MSLLFSTLVFHFFVKRMCNIAIMAGAEMRMRLSQGAEENKVQRKRSMWENNWVI